MGKGTIPDKKDDGEDVKLKPIPEKQVKHLCELMKKNENLLIMKTFTDCPKS
jgi:hypothetical protein